MTNTQINDIFTCSAGTFATLTGLRTYTEVATLTRFIYENRNAIKWQGNAFATIKTAFCKMKATA